MAQEQISLRVKHVAYRVSHQQVMHAMNHIWKCIMKKNMHILALLFIFLTLSCAPMGVITVQVSRDHYKPQLEQSKYTEYKGQWLSFDSIDVSEDPNITNFYYLSSDKTIGYTLYYTLDSMPQPVVSFFWYALQKAFEDVGIVVKVEAPLKNIPQLNLKILTLTDQEAKFRVRLLRNSVLLLEKEIIAEQKYPPTKDIPELEKRQYIFIDSMANAMLTDPDFKREFFSEKGKMD